MNGFEVMAGVMFGWNIAFTMMYLGSVKRIKRLEKMLDELLASFDKEKEKTIEVQKERVFAEGEWREKQEKSVAVNQSEAQETLLNEVLAEVFG